MGHYQEVMFEEEWTFEEVMFEEQKISLDIPEEGMMLENGWTITPHSYPGVSLVMIVVFSFCDMRMGG